MTPLGHDGFRETAMLPADRATAFAVFTEAFDTWWPREYSWAQERLDRHVLQPFEGGHCLEYDIGGESRIWGTILKWEPPHGLALSWQIAPDRSPVDDPSAASRVVVTFLPHGADECEVILDHVDFARHGAGWQDYLKNMQSAAAWPYCLDRFAKACRKAA